MRVSRYVSFLPAFLLLVVGCVGQSALAPVPAGHPANPQAASAPSGAPVTTLKPEPQDQVRTNSTPPHAMEPQGPGEHRHGTSTPDEQTKSSEHGTTDSQGAGQQLFTCQMHPGVIKKMPGKCPKCGMQLVKKQEKPK